MKTRYLTTPEINQMAKYAVANYEFSCSWKSAFYSAASFAADGFGVKATKAQAATAVQIAKTIWEGIGWKPRNSINSSAGGYAVCLRFEGIRCSRWPGGFSERPARRD